MRMPRHSPRVHERRAGRRRGGGAHDERRVARCERVLALWVVGQQELGHRAVQEAGGLSHVDGRGAGAVAG